MEYSMEGIIDSNDFIYISDTDSPELKSNIFQSSNDQKSTQNNKRKHLGKYQIKSPRLSHNHSLQTNHTVVKSTLAQEMVQQNHALMVPSDVQPGILAPESKNAVPITTLVKLKYGAEVEKSNSFTLYPPKNFSSIPLCSKKPPNCKTVWVGGLPKKITENVVLEIFGRFGEIDQLWKKTPSFYHICYKNEESADKAIAFSGYSLIIDGDSENDGNSGLIFMDYSQSRKDVVAQKQNSQKNITQTLPALPNTEHCTYIDLINALKKIKTNDALIETLQEVITWLIRGDCTKCTASDFYNIIIGSIAFARRMVKRRGLLSKKSLKTISAQFNQIQTFLEAVYQPKVWSFFSMPRRKSIETEKAEFQMIKFAIDDELKKFDDHDEDDKPSEKKIKLDINRKGKDDKLLHEIEAYKSQIIAINKRHKLECKELNRRLEEIANLNKNLHNRCNNLQIEKSCLESKQRDYQKRSTDFIAQVKLLKDKNSEEINRLKHDLTATKNVLNKFRNPISLESARLIGLISTFLLSFCTRTHLDDILEYIRKFHINTTKEDLESLMSRCHNVFKKDIDGNWILNIYNTTEIQEDKETHIMEDPLDRMTKITDSLVPTPTSMPERKNKKNTINDHTIDHSIIDVNLTDKVYVSKFSGSLEELYKLYKTFSENTDSSVLQDRKEISVSVLSKISLMISVRQHFLIIRLLLDSLKVDLIRFNYDKIYRERSSLLCDEYFSIIEAFLSDFPETVTKKIKLPKNQEENNLKIIHEPTEKRINNLELQVNEAINVLNLLNLNRFPWEINKFADSKDFLDSFVVHLLNSLYFLQSIRFLSRKLSKSISQESTLNEQQLKIAGSSKQNDLAINQNQHRSELNFTRYVSTAENSLTDCPNNSKQEKINLISTKEIHCDKKSLNVTTNKNHSIKTITHNDNNNQESVQIDLCDTENKQNVELSEIVHEKQSCSFDSEKPSLGTITNQIKKILNRGDANNLKVMYEAFICFKNKQNIQFHVIDEHFLSAMSIIVELLTELHVNIIIMRGLVSVLKDVRNYQQALYNLSEDYFIIFNEFLNAFLTKNTFDIIRNYKNAIDLELKLDESSHLDTYRKFKGRICEILRKLKKQFGHISNITKTDKNIFSNCREFFPAVLEYFRNLQYSLHKFQIFFNLPVNKNFFCQIYAECNNEFPIISRMIENKYLICFTETLNTQEELNMTIKNEQESSSDSKCDKIKEKPAVVCEFPKKETVKDFAKSTQKLRNELQELFEDSLSSKKKLNNFEDNLDDHVSADQC